MGRKSIAAKLKHALLEPHYPDVGIELNSDGIRIAAVSIDKGRIRLQHLDSSDLPEGVIDINPFKPNILSLEPVAEALKTLWTRNRIKQPRTCLLIQDRCALPFNVVMEQTARSHEECLEILRFKLRRSVPFRIEDAKIQYINSKGIADYQSQNLWVLIIHGEILRQYEQVIESAIDVQCGLVDLTTFNLINFSEYLIQQESLGDKDIMYINLNRDYISVAMTQKGALMFYRTRSLEGQNGILEEAMAEIHPAAMYYLDKLGGQKLDRAYIYSTEDREDLSSEVAGKLGLETRIPSIDAYFKDRIDPSNVMMGRRFTPLIGLIASRKVQFV